LDQDPDLVASVLIYSFRSLSEYRRIKDGAQKVKKFEISAFGRDLAGELAFLGSVNPFTYRSRL